MRNSKPAPKNSSRKPAKLNRRVSPAAEKILAGMDDVIAWSKGDKKSARLVTWKAPSHVDVRSIRGRLNMSQREFAACFGLPLAALRNWEQDKRVPNTSARVLLTIIDLETDAVKRALAAVS